MTRASITATRVFKIANIYAGALITFQKFKSIFDAPHPRGLGFTTQLPVTEFVAMSRPLKMRWANYISTFMVDWFSMNSLLGFYLIWNL